jgi:hypothetical protein
MPTAAKRPFVFLTLYDTRIEFRTDDGKTGSDPIRSPENPRTFAQVYAAMLNRFKDFDIQTRDEMTPFPPDWTNKQKALKLVDEAMALADALKELGWTKQDSANALKLMLEGNSQCFPS